MKTLFRHRLISLLVVVLLCLLALPSLAQDGTAEPAATVQQMPMAVVTEEASSGVTVTVNTPAATTDTTASSSTVPTPVVIALAVLLGALFIASLYNQRAIIRVVAPLVPVEAAQGLIDSILPALVDVVMNNVATAIPGEIDDTLFAAAAKQRGLTVTRGEDGQYHTVRTPVTPPADSTLEWKQRPPNRDA